MLLKLLKLLKGENGMKDGVKSKIRNKETRKSTVRDVRNKIRRITLVALFAVLTAVGAQLSVPIGNVPLTFQMFFVFLAGFMLTPYDAVLSMILYLTLGAIGIPVFANFSAGVQHLVGPTAGYLWAFPFAVYIISTLKRINSFIAGALGLVIVYLLGWLILGIHINNFSKSFFVGVLPFVGFDLLKMILALLISKRMIKTIGGMVDERV